MTQEVKRVQKKTNEKENGGTDSRYLIFSFSLILSEENERKRDEVRGEACAERKKRKQNERLAEGNSSSGFLQYEGKNMKRRIVV